MGSATSTEMKGPSVDVPDDDKQASVATGLSELKALSEIIQTSIASIEAAAVSSGLSFPSAATPLSDASESLRNLPEVLDAGTLIVAAASQLVALTRPPRMSVLAMALQFHISTALRIAADGHVAEILREAGPEGRHVNDIAHPKNLDPAKLSRILRLLATNHVFVEVVPDVFANNRLSSVIDTGKSVEELLRNPSERWSGGQGIGALLAHVEDDAFKTSAYLPDVLFDPVQGHLNAPDNAAFNKAFNCDGTLWNWFEAPGREDKLVMFGHAMDGAKNMGPPDTILYGFDWKGLPKGALVVDVGGGIGSQSMTLARHHPHLNFVVQDREAVTSDAASFWEKELPGALASGRVKLQAHNFFDPQPVKNADVFLLSQILHDWPTDHCLTILRSLRAAATPSTRLVIRDNIIAYACTEDAVNDIPGAAQPLPPAPLLPNRGQANVMAYFVDVQMMGFFNGQERTITQVRKMLEKSGWRLAEVHHGPQYALNHQKVIGVPI